MRLLLFLGAALAGVMLFLLATASGNTTLFARHYPLLLGLNAALAALLAALVAWQVGALWKKYRARAFGSRLTVRLLLLLALMAVVPGALVYTVSLQFLAKSIESWFDVKVDAALEGGINLGQSALDQMLGELHAKARALALEIADRPAAQQVVLLGRLRDQAGAQEAVIVSAGGRVIASASEDVSRLVPELPAQQALRQARVGRGYASVEAAAGKPLALRVVVPVPSLALTEEARFLQLRQSVPETFGRSAEAVEAAYRDYRELALSRQGLKRIYIVTLTLALSMALLVAIALAVILANRLSEPLANLAQATQAVARGDFSRRAPVTSRDELGVLTESFNSMTRQLDELIRAQRANAWAEVARRLAHEIKNPLTPIQLSAERLEMKLAGRLGPEEAEALTHATRTIVNQVSALKSMVDDFRDYARLPAPVLAGLDLNKLVGEVLALYEHSSAPIARKLAPGLPPVWADSAQIRQVLHNLVQNAQDALENRKSAGERPRIEVGTEPAGDQVRLTIADNGGGFPAEMMARIFEPYVTTKPRGTGLGLAIVKKIVDEHHGEVSIENRLASGASVSILLPASDNRAKAA